MKNTIIVAVALALLTVGAGVLAFQPTAAEAVQAGNASEMSLITATPEEGFALAVTLARRGVSTTQPDREVLQSLRTDYANDAESLIAVSHVVAVHFQTISEANNYWRD